MTIQTKLKLNYDISSVELKSIVSIKSSRWSYSKEQHKDWIHNNILPEDYHLLVYDDNVLIAYANFVNIKVVINDDIFCFKGIGNVCTSISGKAYGNILMEFINEVLTSNNWHGLLFCGTGLISYYRKFNWELVTSEKVISFAAEDKNILVFNIDQTISSLNYSGRIF